MNLGSEVVQVAKGKSGWVKCSICGAKMRRGKLVGHKKRVHPKGARTREERQKIDSRRSAVSGTAKWLAIAAIIVVIIVVIYFIATSADIRGTNKGDKPPNFTLDTTEGLKYTLDDDLENRPILIDFSSHVCPHCKAMGYILHDLYANYSSEIEIVTVISNYEAKMSDVKDFQNMHSASWTHAHDPGGLVFKEYKQSAFPSYFLVNKEGKIHWKGLGEYSYGELEEKIKEVI